MRSAYSLPALLLALLLASSASAEFVEGIIVDIKKDTFDVMDDTGNVVTIRVSADLLSGKGAWKAYPHHFKQLAMGQEVRLSTRTVKGKDICTEIRIVKPYVPADVPPAKTGGAIPVRRPPRP